MKRLILAVLFAFCSNVFAQVNINNTCSGTTLPSGGGSDTFPWSVARPFPWTSIQGLWTAVDIEKSNLVFEFKVTRTTAKSKQLFVEIYERNNCKKAYMRGVGVVNSTEKNVVRINMNNVLMKVAMFNTADLEMDKNTCGPKSLGATFYRLAEIADYEIQSDPGTINVEQSSNMILKKVSDSYNFRCKQ